MKKIDVLLIHPDRIYHDLLSSFFTAMPKFCLLGQYLSCKDFIDNMGGKQLNPLICVLGLPLVGGEGRSTWLKQEANQIRVLFSKSKILIMGQETEEEVLECIKFGALGYCMRSASLNVFIETLHAMAEGNSLCSPKITAALFSQAAEQASMEVALTSREQEMLQFLNRGCSNKEIAIELNLSVQTIKNHVHNLLQKLKLEGRREAVRFAKEHRLLKVI